MKRLTQVGKVLSLYEGGKVRFNASLTHGGRPCRTETGSAHRTAAQICQFYSKGRHASGSRTTDVGMERGVAVYC